MSEYTFSDAQDNIKFFNDKSIQKSYNYSFWIEDWGVGILADLGWHKDMERWNYIDVTISNYKFDRVSTSYGVSQRSFVVLPKEQNLNVSVVVEEDRYGNVAKLIQDLQRKIISRKGFYVAPNRQYINMMVLDILDDQGFVVGQYEFNNALFMGADDVTRSYGSGDSVKYTLNFGIDRIKYSYVKDLLQDKCIVPISVRIARAGIAAARRAAAEGTAEGLAISRGKRVAKK